MCLLSDPLYKVTERLYKPGVGRFVIVEAGSKRVERIVSLTNVFRFLVGWIMNEKSPLPYTVESMHILIGMVLVFQYYEIRLASEFMACFFQQRGSLMRPLKAPR